MEGEEHSLEEVVEEVKEEVEQAEVVDQVRDIKDTLVDLSTTEKLTRIEELIRDKGEELTEVRDGLSVLREALGDILNILEGIEEEPEEEEEELPSPPPPPAAPSVDIISMKESANEAREEAEREKSEATSEQKRRHGPRR